jgi:cold shock protein
MEGTVKVVRGDKGFGFIRGEDGKEYFFHKSAIQNGRLDDVEGDDRKGKKGTAVTFEPTEGDKGLRAEDVYIA